MLKKIGVFFVVFFMVINATMVFANENSRYVSVEGVVNMRSTPDINSLIVYQLKHDMEVTLLKEDNEWSYISYNGVKGYLKNDFLIQKEEVETSVSDFFYHTVGYQHVSKKEQLQELALFYELPTSQLLKINQLHEKDTISHQLLKTTAYQRLKGKKIILDPGHGGNEAGASSHGIKEGEQTLSLALVVKRHLIAEGAEVVMTVDEHFQPFRRMSLRERASFAKRYGADLFVSLHYNMNENPYAKGTETYFNRTPFKEQKNPYSDESERLANYIQRYLVASIGTNNLGTKDSDYHVLRNNTVPSVLIEMAFLSNEEEAKQLVTEEFKEKSAYGITQGIVHYFR